MIAKIITNRDVLILENYSSRGEFVEKVVNYLKTSSSSKVVG